MIKVTASKRGFDGHKMRKPGDQFTISDESKRGSWMLDGWKDDVKDDSYPGKLEIPITKKDLEKQNKEAKKDVQEKPKRKRRTKEEIEADKAKEEKVKSEEG